ncbi:MAG: division/cell wall cluster transcriptional repressor MraZ [Deltaproteobacteria bacterium]|nr:division/cell wall cluster transcriptional repressor MraZ [Deltaproteobacteria bacterium]
MWQGQYEHAIDAKGRTSVPARLREALAAESDAGPLRAPCEGFVLTAGLDPCLVAYPLSEWRAFEEKLSKLPRFDPHVVKLRRIYVSAAVEVSVDSQGRVLVPPSLRAHARLEKEVVWAGMGRYAELWAKERWVEATTTTEDERRALAGKLAELGL